MRFFRSTFAFAALISAALLCTGRSSFAIPVHSGISFDIPYHMTPPDFGGPPFTMALWHLIFITDPFQPLGGTIQAIVFDSNNAVLGSDTLGLTDEVAHFGWAFRLEHQTDDPIGHFHFIGLSGAFLVDLPRSYVVLGDDFILPGIPVPATLPLFATGLAMMGFLARHRGRKVAVAAG